VKLEDKLKEEKEKIRIRSESNLQDALRDEIKDYEKEQEQKNR
jgi:hypothetical protein